MYISFLKAQTKPHKLLLLRHNKLPSSFERLDAYCNLLYILQLM